MSNGITVAGTDGAPVELETDDLAHLLQVTTERRSLTIYVAKIHAGLLRKRILSRPRRVPWGEGRLGWQDGTNDFFTENFARLAFLPQGYPKIFEAYRLWRATAYANLDLLTFLEKLGFKFDGKRTRGQIFACR
jgi:hypothetical protein